MEALTALGVCIVLLLILITVMVFNTRNAENTLLGGFWTGGAEFCRDSDLELCVLYIEEGSSNTKSGYLIMKNDDGFILNHPVTLHLSGGKSLKPYMCDDMRYYVDIEWGPEEEIPDFFPSQQEIYYYPKIGKMVWLADDKVHLIVYKNSQMCDMRHVLPECSEYEENETSSGYDEI